MRVILKYDQNTWHWVGNSIIKPIDTNEFMKWKYFNKEHNYDEKYEDESENSCDTVKSGAVTSIFFTVGNQHILCYINCPMFGFQSLFSTVYYQIHKGIIWTSTLHILVSLFDIPSQFDTS